ncbi:MAG: DNA polymerase I [Clostridia bacterium]|nr:DNA polymerase I [Clostridia bacterium]
MEKLMVLDGNSIVNRAFYGIRLLTNNEGLYTNAVYGFLNILLKYMEEEKPDGLLVAFDLHAPTFRHLQYDKYKANRKGMPDELRQQMPILKEVLSAMNISMISKEGYEADDLIGTVSQMCGEQGIKCVVLTGDKDDLQLASDNTTIKLITTKGGTTTTADYDYNCFVKEYEITPAQFIDVKGLMGDSSDNIPGVAGIGEKTAFSLIKQFGSIEKIYENIEQGDLKAGVKTKLVSDKENAFLSKKLATIDRFVPVNIKIKECGIKQYDGEKLLELFTRLNFQSFIKKLGLAQKTDEISLSTASDVIKNIKAKGTMYYYVNDSIVVASDENSIAEVNEEQFKELLFEIGIKKISHNIKEHLVKFGIFPNVAFDTMISAYISDPSASSYDLERISFKYLGIAEIDSTKNAVLAIIKLYKYFSDEIEKNGQHELYYNMELPLVTVLASMEAEGVKINISELEKFREKLADTLIILEQEIYSISGEQFNINSPKQLGTVLFETLKLPAGKKTKSGYSTSADVLERLKDEHPIVEKILEYRHIAKLKSTYADGLLCVVNKETHRIYSSFNQTVTVTGRISSTEPNLQNIPVRTELGREIRKMFVAKEDCVLVDADYSQIELRVLAHIAGDTVMTDAFINDADIHTATATQIFNVDKKDVTPTMRSRAKTVNFGIVYGMGEFSLAKDLKIPIFEAKNYIANYFKQFSGVKKYLDEIVEKAKNDGFVTTLLNRRRYLPELNADNFMTRSFGERVAMNTPIQGSAADIIKLAMVKVYNELKKAGLKSKLVLQIHDELIIETYKDEVNQVKEILKNQMENAYKLDVPLKVDMNVGETWYDAK